MSSPDRELTEFLAIRRSLLLLTTKMKHVTELLSKTRKQLNVNVRTKSSQGPRPPLVDQIRIAAGPYTFVARLETALAPKTCAKFRTLLPYRQKVIHVRWSGEACWIPLGNLDLGLGYENPTSYPAPGQFILFPGGISETEILLAYGAVSFASKVGQLAGNQFLTIIDGTENLATFGNLTLWAGAQNIAFDLI